MVTARDLPQRNVGISVAFSHHPTEPETQTAIYTGGESRCGQWNYASITLELSGSTLQTREHPGQLLGE